MLERGEEPQHLWIVLRRRVPAELIAELEQVAPTLPVELEVLLVDEVLSVGDLSFQGRCLDRIFDLVNAGAAVPRTARRTAGRSIFRGKSK